MYAQAAIKPNPLLRNGASKAPAKKMKDAVLGAHRNGRMMLMNEVPDEAFASCAMGDGVSIEPSEGKLFAPADGVIETVFDTKHAIGLTTDNGAELLLHIGIDTVKLNGKYFETHVEPDQHVSKGDLLVSFDLEAVKAEGYPLATGEVKAGQDLIAVKG